MGLRWLVITLTLVALGRVASADETIADLTKACDGGKVDACIEVGTRFDEAKGVVGDPAKALSFFLQACTLKSGRGCSLAADRLSRGAASFKDPARARTLLEKACDLNEPTACNNLGVAAGDKGNDAAAATLFEKGCKLDAAAACFNRATLFGEKGDLKKAAPYFERACDLGEAEGCNSLAAILSNENKLAVADHAKFVAALKRSCSLANGNGCLNVGYVYESGIAVTANIQEAVRNYLRACTLKVPLGCERLGALYELGTDVPRDVSAATAHYDAACTLKSAVGCEGAKRLRSMASSSVPVATPGRFELDSNGALVLPSPIDFNSGWRDLPPESAAGLDHVAAYLSAKPEITLLRIESHFGMETTTRPLDVMTKERALKVARALVDRGVDCKRLLAVGFGADKPIVPNDTRENREINNRIVIVNAELNGKPIAGMPVDGGGSVADPVCKDGDAPPQEVTAPEQRAPLRAIARGIIHDGTFAPGDETTLFGYADTVEFDGEKGDYVSVYSDTHSVLIEVHGDRLETLGKVEHATGAGGLATTVHRLHKAGPYRLRIMGNCDGGDFTKGTCVPRSGSYVIQISSSAPDEEELRDRVLHLPVERRLRAFLTLSPLAVGVTASSRPGAAFNVSFAVGYQITRRYGIDLLASGSLIGGADFGEKQTDRAFGAFAALIVGPRFRWGSKRNGFLAVTPGLSYLTSLKGVDADDEIDASGLGLRVERHDTKQTAAKFVIYGELHLHGDVFAHIGIAVGL